MGPYFPLTSVCCTGAHAKPCFSNTDIKMYSKELQMSHLCVLCNDRCKPWMRCQLWVLFQLDTQASISPRASQVSAGQRMKRVRWKRTDALVLIFVLILCVCPAVCIRTTHPEIFPCFSLFLLAPSFLLLLSGHEVARGYSVLSDPIIVSVEERQGQMRDGKTKRWIEQDIKVDELRGQESGASHRQRTSLHNFLKSWSRLIRTISVNVI